jgi:hypothetical protein
MRLEAFVMEYGRGAPKPIEESRENDEMAEATNDLPAPGPFLEAAAPAFLLLRSICRESRVGVLVIIQELLILGIEGQRNRLLRLEENHDGRRE